MKIVHLVAGAGEMYCGSCLHANTLAAAIRRQRHDVILAPLYMPLRTDEDDASIERVAFGGINVYLQQHSALFRHTPWFLDGLFDRPGLLRWLGKHTGNTRAEKLGPLTISMLEGEEGRQRKELDKLVSWLGDVVEPEVIHLSNVMLAGMAKTLARDLNVPIVSSLSGEDIFLEALPEPYYSQARELLRQRAADLDGLVAMNRYYADFMRDYLAVPEDRVHVIPPGFDFSGFEARDDFRSDDRPVAIGYFARICPEKGLHLLVEAFRLLSEDEELPPIRLLAAGYLGSGDKHYLERIEEQLADWNLTERFEYVGEVDRVGKIAFLRSLDVMSVPTIYRESKGLSIFEAWAVGVPVVLPNHGVFPELIAETGGGLLFEPENPVELAAALKRMIRRPDLATSCGSNAREMVAERYNATLMASRTVELYRDLLSAR